MGLGKAKLTYEDRTKSPFKVRPMTKNADVLEYFPANDPLKMGRTKKRKLRVRPDPKKVIAQQGQITVPGVSGPQARVPYGINKLAFGMAQPPLAVQNPALGNQQQAAVGPQLSTTNSQVIAQQPALTLDGISTEGTTTISNHDFIPAECTESDFEGNGPNAELCKMSSAAATMSLTLTRAGGTTTLVDMNAQHFESNTKKSRIYPEVPGQKLVHVNSEEIDDQNKVSSLIESVFAPAMQPDIHNSTDNIADNQQHGTQKLKEIDKSIMSMLYASDKENKKKAKLDGNVNNDSGFKDYKVPREEGLALPDYIEGFELDEPNEFKFRAVDSDIKRNSNSNNPANEPISVANNPPNKAGEEPQEIRFEAADYGNEHTISNNNADQEIGDTYSPTDQAIAAYPDYQALTTEGRENFNFDTYLASLLSPFQQSQDPGAGMADEVTNIPRYREDTDPPEGYLDK